MFAYCQEAGGKYYVEIKTFPFPNQVRAEPPDSKCSHACRGKRRAKSYAEKAGISLSEALLILAGELEIKLIPIEEARKASREEAKILYAVTYPCRICRNPIVITSPKAKEAAARYMTEHGWGHAACHKQVNNQ